jgi:DNA invertase Pin-like site-specific DNA recombinase
VHNAVQKFVQNAVHNVKMFSATEFETMKIGYARVSAKWYQSELQVSELERQGCDKIWKDSILEAENPDKALRNFLKEVSKGDTVVATRLASVANSAPELLQLLEKIRKKGAHFRSISEPWADTSSAGGDHIIDTIRGIIDFEIAVADAESRIEENRPKTFGVSAGRPQKLAEQQRQEAFALLKMGKSAAEVSRVLGVSRSTISRLKKEM